MKNKVDLQRFVSYTSFSINIICTIITCLYSIPTYLLWMWVVFLPFRIMDAPVYWYLESKIYGILYTLVATWFWRSKYLKSWVVEMGDDIRFVAKEKCLFLVNHQSLIDAPLLMFVFQEKDFVPESTMWILESELRYTHFGAISATRGDYFITRGRNFPDNEKKKLRDHLLKKYLRRNRKWIILFPEGGFLSKRLERSVKYAIKNNFPILEYVTLPRMGAMEVILNTLGPHKRLKDVVDDDLDLLQGTEKECEHIKWVIDATIAYPERHKPVDLFTICTTFQPRPVYVHYRCYPIHEVPLDSTDSLRDWTYKCWSAKEELLKEYYETGKFPHVPAGQRKSEPDNSHLHKSHELRVDIRKLLLVHTFFLPSTLFHYYLLLKVWNFIQYQMSNMLESALTL